MTADGSADPVERGLTAIAVRIGREVVRRRAEQQATH